MNIFYIPDRETWNMERSPDGEVRLAEPPPANLTMSMMDTESRTRVNFVAPEEDDEPVRLDYLNEAVTVVRWLLVPFQVLILLAHLLLAAALFVCWPRFRREFRKSFRSKMADMRRGL